MEDDLVALLNTLNEHVLHPWDITADYLTLLHLFSSLHQQLHDDCPSTKILQQYHTLEGILIILSKLADGVSRTGNREDNYDLIKSILSLLSTAIINGKNQSYFTNLDGYKNIYNAVSILDDAPFALGLLFSFCLDDFTLTSAFKHDSHRLSFLFSDCTIRNAEIIPFVLEFNHEMETVWSIFKELINHSKYNLIKSYPHLITALYTEWDKKEDLMEKMIVLGLPPKLVRDLLKKALTSSKEQQRLLDTLIQSRTPSHFHFDLTFNGYSAIEMSNLPKPFPPSSSSNSNGYSINMWIHLERFDETSHLVLYDIHDPNDNCISAAYIEAESRKLVVQTYSKNTIRFKHIFEEGKWYMLTIVHRRPKTTSSAKCSLHINGRLLETLKCVYPKYSPQANVIFAIGASESFSNKLGQNMTVVRWSCASAHLVDEIIDESVLSVWYYVGPRYKGNYQDNLGQFMTYSASTVLSMMDSVKIVDLVRTKTSKVIPETRFLVSVSPENVLSAHDELTLRKLSRKAYNELKINDGVVLNSAIPKIDEALILKVGLGCSTGEATAVKPFCVDDIIWTSWGCYGALLMIEKSEDPIIPLKLLCECIRDSWRNSEDMERCHGYEILAFLLKKKAELSIDILDVILEMVGFNARNVEESAITNAVAYRYLLLDFSIWKSSSVSVRNRHLEQFAIFSFKSKKHQFNSKRLSKLNCVQEMLHALRRGYIPQDNLQSFVSSLKIVVGAYFTKIVLKTIALFITYSIVKVSLSTAEKRKSNPKTQNLDILDTSDLSLKFGGHLILRMITDMLCDKRETFQIELFTNNINDKFVLSLLREPDARVVVESTRILGRTIVSQSSAYHARFANKTNGYILMKHYIPKWWNVTSLWYCLNAIMLGVDCAQIDIHQPLTYSALVATFLTPQRDVILKHSDVFPALSSMLKLGIGVVVREEIKIKESSKTEAETDSRSLRPNLPRLRSRSLTALTDESLKTLPDEAQLNTIADMLNGMIQFWKDVHSKSTTFSNFTNSAPFLEDILSILFPIICATDIIDAESELYSKDNGVSFEGEVIIDSLLKSDQETKPVLKPILAENANKRNRQSSSSSLQRSESFIIVSSEKRSPAALALHVKDLKITSSSHGTSVIQNLMELLTSIIIDSIFKRKDAMELSFSDLLPPGFQEHHIFFLTYLWRNILSHLKTVIDLNMIVLSEVRCISNLSRFCKKCSDGIFQGRFLHGSQDLFEFLGFILTYLTTPETAKLKSVRLCEQAVVNLHKIFYRIILYRLSELSEEENLDRIITFLAQLLKYDGLMFQSNNTDPEFLSLLSYHLYNFLKLDNQSMRVCTMNVFQNVFSSKSVDFSTLFKSSSQLDAHSFINEFQGMISKSPELFISWFDDNRLNLDQLFLDHLGKSWEEFVSAEHHANDEASKLRLIARKDKLKTWMKQDSHTSHIISKYEAVFDQWSQKIYTAENGRATRKAFDDQDQISYLDSKWDQIKVEIFSERGLVPTDRQKRWRLDVTEGRDRMRKKFIEETEEDLLEYKPKTASAPQTPIVSTDNEEMILDEPNNNDEPTSATSGLGLENEETLESTFEFVNTPAEEDTNRKLLRSLERGDKVMEAYNVSRVDGLDACEGLLLIGQKHIYILDNFFKLPNTDEIVNVWDAPLELRNQYLQLLAGHDEKRIKIARNNKHEARHWLHADLLVVSKKRFIFRDIALELFFSDGRSYLLLLPLSKRSQIFNRLNALRSEEVRNLGTVGDGVESWLNDSSRNGGFGQQIGSRLANVWSGGGVNSAMKKWQRREITNFEYLMMLNTFAGRTYNDLTQYPVFPWIIADYTSKNLDLNDPKSFRDLSKPMGAQSASRAKEFAERFSAFEELQDNLQPPFHYGTHYSSAMIVCSYLIRLQPFVKSYLSLQGGQFDHADRLFHSIQLAWEAASKSNMTDVRELIPEFFYLPNFLVNANSYNFGLRQETQQAINDVMLPPWANNSAEIFISKHREALESEYVNNHLHEWIDLIFGYKQNGNAAKDAINVFHHLSYEGSVDLDAISDPIERKAAAGTIYNFGQTPSQLFTRPHLQRINNPLAPSSSFLGRFENNFANLLQSFNPIQDVDQQVDAISLVYTASQPQIIVSISTRHPIAPLYENALEFGLADNSVRHINIAENRPLTVFEIL